MYPSTNYQFSKSMKSSTFHIFLNLTYPLRKNISFTKFPKIYTKPPNSCYSYKHRDLALLETWATNWWKGRVKRRQNCLHVYPALNRLLPENNWSYKQFQFKRYQDYHELNTLAEFGGHETCKFKTTEDRNKLATKTRLPLVRVQMLPQGSKWGFLPQI